MRKQKGGYPFTDSWFEFPFWFLFLIILIVIGLAAGGIFNSKSIPLSKPLISGQTWHQPEFNITNAYMENNEAVITYVTNQPYQGLIVKLRLVDGKTNNPWQDFSIGTKTVRIQSKNPSSIGLSVEGYIDYQGTPVTPVTNVPVTKDAKNISSNSGNLMLFTSSNKNTSPYKSPLPPPQLIKTDSPPNSASNSGSGSIVTPPSSKPKILPGVPTPTPKPTILPGVPTPAPKPTILPGVPTPSTQKSSLPGSLHENFWPF